MISENLIPTLFQFKSWLSSLSKERLAFSSTFSITSIMNVKLSALISWQGSLEVNRAFWLALIWSGFRHSNRFQTLVSSRCIFCVRKPANSNQAWLKCHTINYLLTYACASRTEEYKALGRFCTHRADMTSGQYTPVRPSHTASKRLVTHNYLTCGIVLRNIKRVQTESH